MVKEHTGINQIWNMPWGSFKVMFPNKSKSLRLGCDINKKDKVVQVYGKNRHVIQD